MGQMSLAEKKKLLANLVKKTQEKYGGAKHVLSFAKDRVDELRYEFIPTPSENVNAALGGGFARGKIIEIAGENSSGKTSLALETIGLDHQTDPESIWGWLDTEGDFDAEYAKMKGVDLDRLILWEVDDSGAESGLDTLEMLIRSNTLKGVVVNSVTGLVPKRELESEMEKQEVALQARMMSKLMRKITAICNRTKTSVIFINQWRTNVGVMFGDNNETTGGRALKYFSTQRITLRKVKVQKEDGITEDEGIKINVKVTKNRCVYDNPYKTTSYTVIFGQGIDTVRELAQLALDTGVASGSGWIYVPNKENPMTWNGTELKFQGKTRFLDFIREHPDFQEYLRNEIRGKIQLQSLSEEEIAQIEEEQRQIESEFADLEAELGEE